MKIRQAITWSVLVGILAVGTMLWLWNRHRTGEARIMARGSIALQRGDVNQAAEAFKDARQRYPRSYAPAYWLAVAELRLGRTDEARAVAQEAARLDPKKVGPYVVQAGAFRMDASRKGDALARVPSEPEFIAAEGLCGQAIKVLEQAEPIGGKNDPEVLAERGFCENVLARLYQLREETLNADARRLEATDAPQASTLRNRAEEYRKKKVNVAELAIASLLASLREQKKNARAAETAQELALAIGKPDVVLEAYEMLASADAITPRAAIQAAQSLMNRAMAPVSAEDWKASQRAVDILESFIKGHPKTVDVRVVLARVLLTREEKDAADKVVSRILELEPASQWGRLLKGQLLLAAGKGDQAKAILQPLGTAMRDVIPYKLAMAEAQRQTGYPQVARQLYREVLDLEPGNADANLALVRDLLDGGQTEAAEAQLASALTAAPRDERILRFAVQYDLTQGKTKDAVALLKRTGELPNLTRGLRETVAYLYLQAGEPDLAEEMIKQAGPGEAAGATIWQKLVLAELAIRQDRLAEGRRMLEELVAANPKWAQGYLGLARAYLRERRGEDAAKAVKRALEMDARDPSIQLTAARIYFDCGMLDDARAICETLLSEAPNNQVALTLAAQIAMQQQDVDSAAKRLAAINALTGGKTQDWLIQAQLAFFQGQYAKCVEICKDRNDVAAVSLTADALVRLGKGQEAAEKLAGLVEQQPDLGQAYERLVQIWLGIDTPAGAMERIEKLKNANPLWVEVSKGTILVAMGRIDDAIAIYTKFLADPKFASAPAAVRALRTALATCYRKKNDPDGELKQYEAIAADKDTRIDGQLLIYQFDVRTNRLAQANEVLDKLSREAGDGESALPLRRRLADSYARIGQTDKSISELNRAIAVRPDSVQLVLDKITVYMAAGKPDDALNCVDEALRRWPDDIRFLKALVGIQASRHDYTAALAALDRMAATGETGRMEAGFQRCALFVQMGLYVEAAKNAYALARNLQPSEERYVPLIGQALIGLNRNDEAKAILAKVPASSPYYRTVQGLLAVDLQRMGKSDEAIKVLRALLEARADDAQTAAQLCGALTQAGRLDEAMQVAEAQLARLAPRTPEARGWKLTIASIRGKKRDWAGAAATLQDLVNTFPEQGSFRWQLALYQVAAGQVQAAAKLLANEPADSVLAIVIRSLAGGTTSASTTTATATATATAPAGSLEPIIRNPRAPDGERLAAVLTMLACEGDAQKVLSALQDVKTPLAEVVRTYLASPSDQKKIREVCALLAEAMIAQVYGDNTLAVYFCERANQLDAGSPLVATVWIPLLAQLGQHDEAAKVSKGMLEVMGRTTGLGREVVVWQALVAGDYEAALKKLDEAEAAGPVSASLMKSVADGLRQKGRLKEALKQYELALAAEPDSPDTSNNVAYLLAEVHGDDPAALDRAAKLVDKALSLSPNNPGILETRGWVRVKRGEAKAALADFLTAFEAIRNSPLAHCHLAVCYLKLGQTDLARLHLQNVVSLGAPDSPEVKLAKELLSNLPPAAQPATSAPVAAAK
jgi:tetratricopeptide (TPR) repeat protein